MNGFVIVTLWIGVFCALALWHLGMIVFTARSVGWRYTLLDMSFIVPLAVLLYGVGMPLVVVALGAFMWTIALPALGQSEVGTLIFAGVCFIVLVGAFLFAEIFRWPLLIGSWRGVALLLAKRYADALANFDRLVKLRPKSWANYSNQAIALYHLGRGAEAFLAIEKARTLQRWGRRTVVAMNEASILFALQRPFDALAVNEQELRQSSPNSLSSVIWERQSFYLAQFGRYPEALAASAQALTLVSRLSRRKLREEFTFLALTAQADALNGLGRYTEALVAAEQAIPLNATPVRTQLARALALVRLGRFAEERAAAELGLSAVDALIKSNPSVPVHAETYNCQALLLRMLGRASEADAAVARSQALYAQMANPIAV